MTRQHDIVIGLGFGDEGKGTMVDYLAKTRKPRYVVRFSGGPQAAHNVSLPDGRHHTFASFGSGTFQGVGTILSRYMIVNPFNMAAEAEALEALLGYDPFERTLISENAPLVTPLHVAANEARELARGRARHGSCGQGIGEVQLYATNPATKLDTVPVVRDLLQPKLLRAKLVKYSLWVQEQLPKIQLPELSQLMASYAALIGDNRLNIVTDERIGEELAAGYSIFEGSQGILLDEWLGFHPHTTWSTTTSENAQQLLLEANLEPGRVIGVIRTYTTRHGAGPFPSEWHTGYNWQKSFPETHNAFGRWQGAWRVGQLDVPLFRYAVEANRGVDEIALTHTDVPASGVVLAYRNHTDLPTVNFGHDLNYQQQLTDRLLALRPEELVRIPVAGAGEIRDILTDVAKVEVRYSSYGPTAADKREHRP